ETVFTQPISSTLSSFDSFPIWTAPLFNPGLLNPYAGIGPNGESLDGQSVDVAKVKLDGRPVESLVGMQLEGETTDGTPTLLQVTGIASGAGGNADLLYYVVHAAEGADWTPLCGTSAAGEPIPALAVPGSWDHRAGTAHGGEWESDGQTFNFACRGSSIAKCMEAGYRPWVDPASTPGNIQVRGEQHMNQPGHLQACVRMLRGDYCGDGTSHTVSGRLVEFWDSMGLHARSHPEFTFEAAWTADGASTLDFPRVLRDEGLPSCAYDVPWSTEDMHDPSAAQLGSLRSQGHMLFSAYERQLYLSDEEDAFTVSTDARALEMTRTGHCVHLEDGLATNGRNIHQQACNGSAKAQRMRFIPRGDHYEIRHEASGKCLDVQDYSDSNGANVYLFECHAGDNQLWEVQELTNTGDSDDFMLVNKHSGKCLDLHFGRDTAGTNLHQWSCSATNRNQHFRQNVLVSSETRSILTRHNKCLNLPQTAENDRTLVQWSCHAGAEQDFRLVRRGSDYELLHESSGTCIEVSGASSAKGASIVAGDCGGADHQLWTVRDQPRTEDPDDFYLVNKNSGGCLDLNSGRSHDGADMHQWPCHSYNQNQHFKLRP
ncbi:MAG: RICIN domain-containing protein, partial [Myxococcota bacterium]